MSLAFLTKPIGGSKKDKSADSGATGPDAPRGAKPGPLRGGAAGSNLAIGGAPRVDLMPPEIRTKRSQLRIRRSLRLALVGVLVIVIAACGGTWALATVAQTTLTAAQAQQQQLVATQAKYSDVTGVKSSIALVQAGQKVGDSTEIDWSSYLSQLQATLPSGVQLQNVTVLEATPFTAFGQATTPLQGSRIATLTFTATSAGIPSIPVWLDGLKTLPGFVDATPGSVAGGGDDGSYTANVEMHINTQAFTNRFDKAAAAANLKAIAATKAAAAATGGN
jgi:hypothetical protein